MRRSAIFVSFVIAAVLVAIVPAASAETIQETVPKLRSTPLEKACDAMDIVATDRNELTATSTFDEKTLLSRRITGSQITLFEWVNSGNSVEIETLGTRTITRNADGTYTLVQRGTGYWYDDGTVTGTGQLLRFTGTVRSVGDYDSTTFTFTPHRTTISGVTATICEMLVTGLKARH